jgi:7-carboxy-7-deazaguanine synthase
MKISEIFLSFQGEGVYSGLTAVFVRVGGCNLSCKWCDTEYAIDPSAEYKQMTPEEVAGEVLKFDTKHVVITGGEPMLYRRKLVRLTDILRKEGRYVTIETNGTIFTTGLRADLISISPKLPSAGQKNAINYERIKKLLKNHHCQIKLVIDNDRDLKAAVVLLNKISYYKFEGPILQPNGLVKNLAEYRSRLKHLYQTAIIDDNKYSKFFRSYKQTRVMPQLQVVAFGKKRGV